MSTSFKDLDEVQILFSNETLKEFSKEDKFYSLCDIIPYSKVDTSSNSIKDRSGIKDISEENSNDNIITKDISNMSSNTQDWKQKMSMVKFYCKNDKLKRLCEYKCFKTQFLQLILQLGLNKSDFFLECQRSISDSFPSCYFFFHKVFTGDNLVLAYKSAFI